jgi:hypothetical protein
MTFKKHYRRKKMEFFIRDEKGNKIATFIYFTATDDCLDCKAIIVKKGSLMSKSAYCMEKWNDCKWIEDDRQEAIKNAKVEDHNDEYYILIDDLMFKSPVKAASIILGHIENDAWNLIKNDDNKSLMEVYRA